jgi:hypothetical protein
MSTQNKEVEIANKNWHVVDRALTWFRKNEYKFRDPEEEQEKMELAFVYFKLYDDEEITKKALNILLENL